MMTAQAILHRCQALGISIRENNGRLLLECSKERPDPALRDAMKRHYRALVRVMAHKGRREWLEPPATTGLEKPGRKAPLSPYQRGFYAESRESDQNISGLNQVAVFDLSFRPDSKHLDESFNILLDHHTILRTAIISPPNGEPYQVVAHTGRPSIHYHDVKDGDHEKVVEGIVHEHNNTPFDLENDPLIRAALVFSDDGRVTLIVTFHHIIIDGWSIDVLMTDWMHILKAVSEGQEHELQEQPFQYGEYSTWACETLLPAVQPEQEVYWRSHLARIPELHGLPTDFARSPLLLEKDSGSPVTVADKNSTLIRDSFPAADYTSLRKWAAGHGCSVFSALYTAMRIAMQRFGGDGQDPVLTIIATREQTRGMERAVGFFINVLPLYCPLKGGITVKEALMQSNRTIAEAQEHQDIPFSSLVDSLKRPRNKDWHPVGQVLLLLQNAFDVDNKAGLQPRLSDHPFTEYELSLLVWDYGRLGIFMDVEYDRGLYEENSVRNFLKLFMRVCSALPANEQCLIRELPLYPVCERARHEPARENDDTQVSEVDLSDSLKQCLLKGKLSYTRDVLSVSEGLRRIITSQFSEQSTPPVIIWHGPHSEQRLVLQLACILRGYSFAICPWGHEKSLPCLLEASVETGALLFVPDNQGTLPANHPQMTTVLRVRDLLEAVKDDPVSSEVRTVGQNRSRLWMTDGMGLTGWFSCFVNEAESVVCRAQKLLASYNAHNLAFLEGEDADQTGLLSLAAILLGGEIYWGPEKVPPKTITLTTSLEEVLSIPPDSEHCMALINHLPTARLLAKYEDNLRKTELLLRVPGSLEYMRVCHDRTWTGRETFCRVENAASGFPGQRVPGEMYRLGNSLECRVLDENLAEIPLPGGCAVHVWRNGHAVDLDQLTVDATGTDAASRGSVIVTMASPDRGADEYSLLSDDGELVAWATTEGARKRAEQQFRCLPRVLCPTHFVLSTRLPFTIDGNPDRRMLARTPLLSSVLLERLQQREPYNACSMEAMAGSGMAARMAKYAADHAFGKLFPGNSVNIQMYDQYSPGVLFEQSDSSFMLRPVIRPVHPVPDWETPFAKDRHCLIIASSSEGLALAESILDNSQASVLLLELAAIGNACAGPKKQWGGRLLRYGFHDDGSMKMEAAMITGREHFQTPLGGVLWILDRASHCSEKDWEYNKQSLEKVENRLRQDFPEVPLVFIVSGQEACDSPHSRHHRNQGDSRKQGFAGSFFDRLVRWTASLNHSSPHSRLCFYSLFTPDQRMSSIEDREGAAKGSREQYGTKAMLYSFFAALQSGHDAVIGGAVPETVFLSGYLPGFCEAAEQAVITYAPHKEKAGPLHALPHPLGACFGRPSPVLFRSPITDGVPEYQAPDVLIAADAQAAAVYAELKKLWGGILSIEDPDPDANFFDLGGSSVLVPRVRDSILHAFGVDIGMVGVFRYSTLHELQGLIIEKLSGNAAQHGLDGLPSKDAGARRRERQREAGGRRKRKQEMEAS